MELLGEYVGLDGQQRLLRVPCEAPADADPFQGLLSGVAQMRELVAELFDPLVQQEAQDREAAAAEEADGSTPNMRLELMTLRTRDTCSSD
ncbi:EKC/KEOPS complex subunit GON7 isoform X2 [Vulpes vulpes]|uniref:EKC/KEOPS complex subunit GON7 isoform X2 n=1 Tax=Vulpes vulpes TaxID=9627 RepID=A0ABM4ZGP2_VULVU